MEFEAKADYRARKAVTNMAKALHMVINAFQDLMLAMIDVWTGPSSQWNAQQSKDSIEGLDLSVRAHNALKQHGIHTIGQLCRMNVEDIRALQGRYGFGRLTIKEVLEKREGYMRFMSEEKGE